MLIYAIIVFKVMQIGKVRTSMNLWESKHLERIASERLVPAFRLKTRLACKWSLLSSAGSRSGQSIRSVSAPYIWNVCAFGVNIERRHILSSSHGRTCRTLHTRPVFLHVHVKTWLFPHMRSLFRVNPNGVWRDLTSRRWATHLHAARTHRRCTVHNNYRKLRRRIWHT